MKLKYVVQSLGDDFPSTKGDRPLETDQTTPTIIDELCPPDPSPAWPETRSYDDIIQLHSENSMEAAQTGNVCVRDFAKEFLDCATVIDIGAGKGVLIADLRQMAQKQGINFNLVAVGATVLDAEHAKSANYVYYQKVPDHDRLLEDYANKADFVIDTFGAATYATNPIHALIYSILLLKPGAKYTAISSLVPGAEDYSAFGDINTQLRLIEFFRKHLALELSIKPTYLRSKVKGNEGVIVQDLLIHCERVINCKQEYSLNRFKELAKLVNQYIGTPEILSVWNNADFGKFQIRRIRYNRPLELKEPMSPRFYAPRREVATDVTDEVKIPPTPQLINF